MSLVRSTSILMFGNLCSRVLSFGGKIILARLLTATELGGWHLLQTWYLSLSGPFIGVIQQVVTQLVASYGIKTKQRTLLLSAGIYCFLGFTLMMLPMLLLPEQHHPEGSAYFYHLWFWLLPSYIITVAVQVLKGWLMGRQQVAPVVVNQWLEQAIEVAGMVALLLKNDNRFEALILVFLAADLLALLHLVWCWFHYRDRDTQDKHELGMWQAWSNLLAQGIPHSLSRGVGSLGRLAEAWLIPLLLIAAGLSDTESLGLYGQLGALAMPTLMMPSMLVGSLAMALLPEIAAERKPERRRRLIRRSISIALTFGLSLGIFFSLEGVWLGELVFDSSAVGQMISVLAPMSLLVYVDIVASQLLRAVGRSMSATIIDMVTFIAKLILLYAGIQSGRGFSALAEAHIVGCFVAALLDLSVLLKEVHLDFALLEWFWQPVLIALPVTGILLIPLLETTPLLRIVQVVLAFVTLGVLVLWQQRTAIADA